MLRLFGGCDSLQDDVVLFENTLNASCGKDAVQYRLHSLVFYLGANC